ncbi:MAG: ABC transporter permease [Rubripirellula sp.]
MWLSPLLLTLQLMAVSVTIAAVVGVVAAWATSVLASGSRFERRIANFFLASMVVALAIPMVMHAAAWEATAGKFGWMIMTQTGSRADRGGPFGFFTGLVACSWIHGLIGAAIVALATHLGTRGTPVAVIQQSRLEIGPLATWWRIRLPIAGPWVAMSLLATAMLAATEMTVADLYGYRTIADQFYLFYASDPTVAQVLMTCFLPLALASCGLVWWLISRRRLSSIGSSQSVESLETESVSRLWRGASLLIVCLIACLITMVPVMGLLVKIGHQVVVEDGVLQATWSLSACLTRLTTAPKTFSDEYFWTALISITTGLAALGIAWPLAALGRTHRRFERSLDGVTIAMLTIPGPIVGLALVSFFQLPIPGFRGLYHQSIVPTVIALLVRALPVAYWMIRVGYRRIDTPTLEAAQLDVPWWKRLVAIDFPLLRGHLLTAMLAATVVASGDVPATLPVIPAGVATVGTRLFQLLHNGARYQEAALAIWYVTAIVLIAIICLRQGSTSRVRVE